MKPIWLLLLAFFLPTAPEAADKIRIAYPSTSFTTLPIFAAIKHGHFKHEGLEQLGVPKSWTGLERSIAFSAMPASNARSAIDDMTLDQWNLLIDTHVTGAFNFCQPVLRSIVNRGSGAIVITSSDFAVIGVRNAENYCAARTALYSLTKSLALEFAPCGIRVNAIGPGPIDTPLLRKGRTPGEYQSARRTFESRLPMQRLGQPEEVAAVVEFLLSDRAAYINRTTPTAEWRASVVVAQLSILDHRLTVETFGCYVIKTANSHFERKRRL